jgi:hypothetical protein
MVECASLTRSGADGEETYRGFRRMTINEQSLQLSKFEFEFDQCSANVILQLFFYLPLMRAFIVSPGANVVG